MTEPNDVVNHPPHYTQHPSGVECIDVTEHMSFNLGNAVKYIWRADLKGSAIEDLEKAEWYVRREIERRRPTKPTESLDVAPDDPTQVAPDGRRIGSGARAGWPG